MTAVLAIAKGIGIFLLVLLTLLILVLLAALFVPVSYRAEGEYRDGFWARASAAWFFGLVRLNLSLDNEFSASVRAAGILLYPPRAKKAGEKEENTEETKEVPKREEETGTGDFSGPSDDFGPMDRFEAQDPDPFETVDKKTAGKTSSKRGPLLRKIRRLKDRFREKRTDAERIKSRLLWYWRLLEREDSRRALNRVGGEFRRLLSHCLPQKGMVCVTAGARDPAVTGGLLALEGMLYPLLCGRIVILPDFETPRLEGTFWVKGRIQACVVCYCILRVVLNRECRLLLARLRKKEEA